MSTTPHPIPSNANRFYDDQFNPRTTKKESWEGSVLGTEAAGKNGRPAKRRSFEDGLKKVQTDFSSTFLQQVPVPSGVGYNDIPSDTVEPQYDNNLDIKTVQQVRAALSNPEAEAASKATTVMLIMISLLGDFQKAKTVSIISNLDSVLAKMSTKIAEMKKEQIASFDRDMVNFGGDLLVNGTSLCVSIASARTLEVTRSSLLSEQNNLSMAQEYRSLAKIDSPKEQLCTERMETIQEHFKNNKLTCMDNDQKSLVKEQKGFDQNTPEYIALQKKIDRIEERKTNLSQSPLDKQIPEIKIIKEKIENYQTQIASFEARHQLINNIAAFLKNAFVSASAVRNRDASEAKINETQADQTKEKFNTDMQLDRESLSATRDASMKLLAMLEKMLEAMPEMTKVMARNARS